MDSDLMRWVKAQADDPNANPRFRELLAALESAREDAERMSWLATGGCVEGFVDADMLRGLRRLVDAAIDQALGKAWKEVGE